MLYNNIFEKQPYIFFIFDKDSLLANFFPCENTISEKSWSGNKAYLTSYNRIQNRKILQNPGIFNPESDSAYISGADLRYQYTNLIPVA